MLDIWEQVIDWCVVPIGRNLTLFRPIIQRKACLLPISRFTFIEDF